MGIEQGMIGVEVPSLGALAIPELLVYHQHARSMGISMADAAKGLLVELQRRGVDSGWFYDESQKRGRFGEYQVVPRNLAKQFREQIGPTAKRLNGEILSLDFTQAPSVQGNKDRITRIVTQVMAEAEYFAQVRAAKQQYEWVPGSSAIGGEFRPRTGNAPQDVYTHIALQTVQNFGKL